MLSALVVACFVPVLLHRHVVKRLARGALPALSLALGERLHLGDVEVTLLGTLRLSDVSLGTLLRVKSIEASVGLGTLLSGSFAASEVVVDSPHVLARTLPDGSLDASVLIARVRDLRAKTATRAVSDPAPRKSQGSSVRRIVVKGGELVLALADRGELRAREVELHPQEGGVRIVTGGASLEARAGALHVDATFARAGVDLDLPSLRVGRAALDGGRFRLSGGQARPLEILDVVFAHGTREGTTYLTGKTARGLLTVKLRRQAELTRVVGKATALPLAVFGAWLPEWIDVADGSASGELHVAWNRASRTISAESDTQVQGVKAVHPMLSSSPLLIDTQLEVQGEWNLDTRIGRAKVQAQTGNVELHGEGEVRLDGAAAAPEQGLFRVELPKTQCSTLFAAIPPALRAPLDGLEVDGTLALAIDVGFARQRPEEARLDFDVDMNCRVVRGSAASDIGRLRGAYRHTLPSGVLRTLSREDPSFVPLARLPPHVAAAFVAGEDALFYQHHGFDPEQLRRSFAHNLAAGRTLRGGSTITQQLAKNLFLTRERTLARKLIEAAMTWQIEERLSKQRILEIYLNIIELGEGTFGLGPAAHRWFGKEARLLTVAEAAFLASLAPAPVSIERRLRAAHKLDPAGRERVATILRSMRRNRLLDPQAYQAARRQPLQLRL